MGKDALIPAAIVDVAINIEQAKADVLALKEKIAEGDAIEATVKQTLHAWRCQMGVVLTKVRKSIPAKGPKSKAWGEFVSACDMSLDTASNYMKLAEYADRYPVEAATLSTQEIYRRIGLSVETKKNPEELRDTPAPAQIEAPKAATPKAKPEGEKPATPPKAQVKVTYDRGAGGDGEDCQDAPDDGLPTRVIEEPVAGPEPQPFVPALFGGKPDDGAPPEMVPTGSEEDWDLAIETDRARALIESIFRSWPRERRQVLHDLLSEVAEQYR